MGEALHNLGIDFGLLLAQGLNFLILLFILQRFLYKPIQKILDERATKVEKSLLDAEKIEKRLASTEVESAEVIKKSQREAEKILQDTKIENDELKARLVAEANTKSAKLLESAKAEIFNDKVAMVKEVQLEIATLVEKSLIAISKESPIKVDKVLVSRTLEKIKAEASLD